MVRWFRNPMDPPFDPGFSWDKPPMDQPGFRSAPWDAVLIHRLGLSRMDGNPGTSRKKRPNAIKLIMIHIHIYIYIHVYVFMYVCMYLCMYVCMYGWMDVECMYIGGGLLKWGVPPV